MLIPGGRAVGGAVGELVGGGESVGASVAIVVLAAGDGDWHRGRVSPDWQGRRVRSGAGVTVMFGATLAAEDRLVDEPVDALGAIKTHPISATAIRGRDTAALANDLDLDD